MDRFEQALANIQNELQHNLEWIDQYKPEYDFINGDFLAKMDDGAEADASTYGDVFSYVTVEIGSNPAFTTSVMLPDTKGA